MEPRRPVAHVAGGRASSLGRAARPREADTAVPTPALRTARVLRRSRPRLQKPQTVAARVSPHLLHACPVRHCAAVSRRGFNPRPLTTDDRASFHLLISHSRLLFGAVSVRLFCPRRHCLVGLCVCFWSSSGLKALHDSGYRSGLSPGKCPGTFVKRHCPEMRGSPSGLPNRCR